MFTLTTENLIYGICGANILFFTILFESCDTKIIDGSYYGIPCIIKQVSNDAIFGIKSKVLREITALKRNKGRNFVKLYDVKYDENNIYIILEKGGENLLNLSKSEMFDENIIQDITTGLKILHSNNYIHGDLSLKNVVRFNNGSEYVYKLIDFGSSTRTYRQSAVSEPTIYVSPVEMLNQKMIFPSKIDSWALGCLSYYVTTGTILFMEENKEKLVNQINERMGLNKSESRAYPSIGKLLSQHTKNKKIRKSITKLLNVDTRKRYSVTDFYFDSFNDSQNNLNDMHDPNNDSEIFKPNNGKCSNLTRSKLMQIFLMVNIQCNIPIENIFIAFRLLRDLDVGEDEYIQNGIILYSLTTKLVSHIQIPLTDVMRLINFNCNTKINDINQLNSKILELLNFFEWDIDKNTLISYIGNIETRNKMNYLIISLIMLCDVKYDVLTVGFCNKAISILLDYIDGKQATYEINNKYQMFHILNDILLSIRNMDDNNLIQEMAVKKYFESIGITNFSEWAKNIDPQKILKVFFY